MGEVLFGKKRELLDTLADFSHDGTKESYESDAQCFTQLARDMETFREETGHLFVVFLDATHFPYSWPEKQPAQFNPYVEQINYLKVACSQESIEGIKNRYRNAIFYLDQLFGKFSENLKTMTNGEDSVVVLTGDHAEEFSEEGNMFHASDLTDMQTRVPLYYKFGKNTQAVRMPGITSHVDIFPSIISHVFGEELPVASYFDGESIFKENRKQFAVAARYNGNRSPYEFCIHNGTSKCILRFSDKRNIFKSSLIEVVAHKHGKDPLVAQETNAVETEFKQALEHLFVTE
jgi:membrane-anchored protein YejM (alkaline phosphatase superfamily)